MSRMWMIEYVTTRIMCGLNMCYWLLKYGCVVANFYDFNYWMSIY